MENKSIFSILMELPLFSGVTREKMSDVVGKAKFHFLKYPKGTTFINVGEPCTHLKFILNGKVRITIPNSDGRFSVSQTLIAPDVIAPDFMFGMATVYPCSALGLEDTNILQISKSDYLDILNTDPIFLLNYLNLLAMNAQKAVDGVLSITMGSIEERIAFWIIALSKPSGRDIVLQCRQRDLYSVFGVQRSTFMGVLQSLRERGLIDYTPTSISVPDRRALLDLLHSHSE